MSALSGRFTQNKQVVRDLQAKLIAKFFRARLGNLRYFGLCSPEMKDVLDWAVFFSQIVAVERGEQGEEFVDQHELLLTAARENLLGKVRLLRGDIDSIILEDKDLFGNIVPYPFDVVTLDYSGGLFYRTESGQMRRLEAIKYLISKQAGHGRPYLLYLSCNCDAIDAGEVKSSVENVRTQLNRDRWNGDQVCNAILGHSEDVVRLWFYVPFLVNMAASAAQFQSECHKVISYPGNKGVEMLNFRFFIKPDNRTVALRFPQQRLTQVLNSPIIRIEGGRSREKGPGIPRLATSEK